MKFISLQDEKVLEDLGRDGNIATEVGTPRRGDIDEEEEGEGG